ncbi:MAG: ParB/RepB/Spo0J family partition protein [Rhodospirillaceae bacterium]
MSRPRNRPRQSSGLAQAVDFTAPDYVETTIEQSNEAAGQTANTEPKPKPKLMELSLELIAPNPSQVRTNLEDEHSQIKLRSLAQSIENHGLQQPIIVRKIGRMADGAEYQVIAGERRFRAHKILGKSSIQCLVFEDERSFDERKTDEISLIENVQRENLDALDLAKAMKALMIRHHYKQDDLVEILGMAKPTVSRVLGILKLDLVDKYYLDDYKHGVFDEVDEESEDKVVVVRPVREAVSLTALTEFSSLTRSPDYTAEQINAVWQKIRCGKVPTDKIREVVKQAPTEDKEPKQPEQLDEQQKLAKQLQKSFASVEKALNVMDMAAETLSAEDKNKVSQLIQRLIKLIEK